MRKIIYIFVFAISFINLIIPISIASNGNSKVEIKETEEQIAAKNITDNFLPAIFYGYLRETFSKNLSQKSYLLCKQQGSGVPTQNL